MLLFYGDTGPKDIFIDGQLEKVDENLIRAAKIRVLQKTFNDKFQNKEDDNSLHAFTRLKDTKLKQLQGYKKRIILNGHGSPRTFRGNDGRTTAKNLLDAGLNDKDTQEIWVCACLVGMQRQDNKQDPEAYGDFSKNSFSREFNQALKNAGLNINVYVPRGWVTYDGAAWKSVGSGEGRVLTLARVYISTMDTKFTGLDDLGNKIYKEAHGPGDKPEYGFWEGMLLVMF